MWIIKSVGMTPLCKHDITIILAFQILPLAILLIRVRFPYFGGLNGNLVFRRKWMIYMSLCTVI